MSRSLRGLALPAAALLALALGAVSPAVADTPSDASSPEPSTYTTPAKPGVDVAEAPTPAAPQADAAAEDPAEPATSPAADPTADPDAESAADPAAEPAPAEAPPAPQPATGTWVRDAAGWKYVDVDGSAVTNQVKEIDGTTYAFDATGHVARGWWRDAEGRWYLSSDYGVRTGWQRDGANWYYLDSFGVMHTGWLVEGGAWFYFHSTGAMVTGWQRVDGTWYRFSSTGAMMSSVWLREGSTWFYLDSSGAMATGWQSVGGAWFYFHSTGAMATGWLHDGAHWYHLSNTGAMTQGWLHLGDWYYLDPVQGGAMATGWLGIGGHWNYFDAWDGFWVSDRDSFAADWEYARTLYSPTNYLLVVDTSAPHCMSFYWRDGAWQPHHDWPCSVGAPATPTVRGTFAIGSRGRSFGSGYTAYWWTQFHGDYLFHSVLYYQGTYTIKDGTLGGHVSHGCVRMRIEDAKWIHDNIPSGTYVVVY